MTWPDMVSSQRYARGAIACLEAWSGCAGWRDGGQAIRLLDAGQPLPQPRVPATDALQIRRAEH